MTIYAYPRRAMRIQPSVRRTCRFTRTRFQRLIVLAVITSGFSCSGSPTTDGNEAPVGKPWALEFDSRSENLYVPWNVSVMKDDHEVIWTQIDKIDTRSWKTEVSWSMPDVDVDSLTISKDGQTVVGATPFGTIEFWQAATGKHLRTLHMRDKQSADGLLPVRRVLMTPDEKRLAVLTCDDLSTYDISDKSHPRRLAELTGRTMRIASDGEHLLVADIQLGIVRSQITTLEPVQVVVDPDLIETVYGLSTASQKKIVLTSDQSGVKMWKDGKQKPTQVTKTGNPVYRHLSMSAEGTIASATTDKKVYVWRLPEGKELHTFDCARFVYYVSLSPNGKLLAIAMSENDKDDCIVVFDVESGKRLARFGFVDRRKHEPER